MYYWIGFIVFWAFVSVVAALIIFLAAFIVRGFALRLWRIYWSDVTRYYFGDTFDTQILRQAYSRLKRNPRLKTIILKYRLRNIRKAKKWNSK